MVKGYDQIEGLDFVEKFSLVAKMVTVRVLLVVSTTSSWPIFQLNVNNAFFHGYLDEEIFMVLPQGLSDVPPRHVCRLHRSLFVLKQASGQWNAELCTQNISFGFRHFLFDPWLFLFFYGSFFMVLLVYIDDLLLIRTYETFLHNAHAFLDHTFSIKDLGHAQYFLDVKLSQCSHDLYLTQHKYIVDILSDVGLTSASSVSEVL